jgi:hypothetical protein
VTHKQYLKVLFHIPTHWECPQTYSGRAWLSYPRGLAALAVWSAEPPSFLYTRPAPPRGSPSELHFGWSVESRMRATSTLYARCSGRAMCTMKAIRRSQHFGSTENPGVRCPACPVARWRCNKHCISYTSTVPEPPQALTGSTFRKASKPRQSLLRLSPSS